MRNWAILIGIDNYHEPALHLKGAVKDALSMQDWLKRSGQVRAENIVLLLNATYDDIYNGLIDLHKSSKGQGGRLFFFYAGHGISTHLIQGGERDALIPADASWQRLDRFLGLGSIFDFFAQTHFQNQFFFIDSCRHSGWSRNLVLTNIGKFAYATPLPLYPVVPAPQQFIFFATSPGHTAAEVGSENDERGVFAEALLNGLSGVGNAKAWDDNNGYLVRVDRLFDYVVSEVRIKNDWQTPRRSGEFGSLDDNNPILAKFPESHFLPVELKVHVRPSLAVPRTTVRVSRFDHAWSKKPSLVRQVARFTLLPREYSVRANARGYKLPQRSLFLEVYNDTQIALDLVATTTSSVSSDTGSGSDPTFSSGGGNALPPPMNSGDGYSATSRLIVENSDKFAPLEVTDATGKVLAVGQGRLEINNLAMGFYRARLRAPEGNLAEQLVELPPQHTEVVQLGSRQNPATKLTREAIAQLPMNRDGTVEYMRKTGPMASVQLSTILALTVEAETVDEPISHLLVQIRKKLVADIEDSERTRHTSALQVIIALEAEREIERTSDVFPLPSRVKLYQWTEGEFRIRRLLSVPGYPGIAVHAEAAAPATHILALELPGQPPTFLSLAGLPRRLSLLILHRKANGALTISQYFPHITDESVRKPQVDLLRQIDLFQRFYLEGNLSHAYISGKRALEIEPHNPITQCLMGNLLLKLGRLEELQQLVYYWQESTRVFSDQYLLETVFHWHRRNEREAIKSFEQALSLGIPILADSIKWLAIGLHTFARNVDNTFYSDLIRDRVREQLWSAWVPQRYRNGNNLGPLTLGRPPYGYPPQQPSRNHHDSPGLGDSEPPYVDIPNIDIPRVDLPKIDLPRDATSIAKDRRT